MKAILLDVFSVGNRHASVGTRVHTVVELMQRPRVMRKLQAEVRSVVPEGQEIVSEADLISMAYLLGAVIKESLRLRPVTPLLVRWCRTSPWPAAASTTASWSPPVCAS
ncbi:unnamed protein product [Urochloa humidicola]